MRRCQQIVRCTEIEYFIGVWNALGTRRRTPVSAIPSHILPNTPQASQFCWLGVLLHPYTRGSMFIVFSCPIYCWGCMIHDGRMSWFVQCGSTAIAITASGYAVTRVCVPLCSVMGVDISVRMEEMNKDEQKDPHLDHPVISRSF